MKDYSTFTCFDNKSGPKTLKIFLHCFAFVLPEKNSTDKEW